jgi:hypothetical protein
MTPLIIACIAIQGIPHKGVREKLIKAEKAELVRELREGPLGINASQAIDEFHALSRRGNPINRRRVTALAVGHGGAQDHHERRPVPGHLSQARRLRI